MHGVGVLGTVSASVVPVCVNGASLTSSCNKKTHLNYGFPNSNRCFWKKHHSCSLLSTKEKVNFVTIRAASSSSVGSEQFIEEPATGSKFPKSLTLPGCSSTLTLLGTGYREKVFAIIGVKVYAAGFYLNSSIYGGQDAWKGKQPAEIQSDATLFNSIFRASTEKSLKIVLVRDVDGKTFWDALDEAISPRIKAPTPVDESALTKFRSIFQGRPLKKGTSIFLTWLGPTKMLVSISADGLPSEVDATIESENVTNALYDVFLGASPVSPSLKASVADALASALK